MGAKLGSILRYSRHFKLSHLISIFIFIFALLAGVVLWKYDFDDSFIIYRIAENVVNNKGWTFNPGERINGSTSFLWTALQIVGSLIIRNAQHFAHMMTPLALFFNGMLFWILFRKLVSNGIAIMTALFFMSFPLLLRSWGLETQLYLTLALASIYAECCGRSLMLGLALGGLILTRPDGILLAIILLLNRLIFKKRTPWLPTIMIAGLIIPWLIFSYTYFGAFFPNTLAAKMAQARSGLWNFSFSWPFSEFPLFIQGFYYWLRTIYTYIPHEGESEFRQLFPTPFYLSPIGGGIHFQKLEKFLLQGR